MTAGVLSACATASTPVAEESTTTGDPVREASQCLAAQGWDVTFVGSDTSVAQLNTPTDQPEQFQLALSKCVGTGTPSSLLPLTS